MSDGWSVGSTSVHPSGKACDPVGVLSFFAELVAGGVPISPVVSAGGLYVGALLARLPIAGKHDSASTVELLTINVLGIGKPQPLRVPVRELQPAV